MLLFLKNNLILDFITLRSPKFTFFLFLFHRNIFLLKYFLIINFLASSARVQTSSLYYFVPLEMDLQFMRQYVFKYKPQLRCTFFFISNIKTFGLLFKHLYCCYCFYSTIKDSNTLLFDFCLSKINLIYFNIVSYLLKLVIMCSMFPILVLVHKFVYKK